MAMYEFMKAGQQILANASSLRVPYNINFGRMAVRFRVHVFPHAGRSKISLKTFGGSEMGGRVS
jgi:hypothetical protein